MHKIVNGEKIKFTPEEEKKLKEESLAVEAEINLLQARKVEESEASVKVLKASGLTNDVIKIIKPELSKFL